LDPSCNATRIDKQGWDDSNPKGGSMTKTLTLIFAFCCLVCGFEQFVLGQAAQVRTSNSQPAEMTNREQDGLKGPVRRVRVETSTILIKGGEVSEGPRVVRGVS